MCVCVCERSGGRERGDGGTDGVCKKVKMSCIVMCVGLHSGASGPHPINLSCPSDEQLCVMF